jgi:predicted metal-dependent phosphoesterase TrpH
MLKIDLHMHTNYLQEFEANCSPKELIDRASELGYDAIAITEHYFVINGPKQYRQDPFNTYRDFKEYAENKGILLIPGTELRFKEGEVVLFNFEGDVSRIRTLKDLERLPDSVLKIAPHPFYFKGNCLGKHLERNMHMIDAIEYCHFYSGLINRNKKAVKLAKKYGKPLVGTSDAHRLDQLNRTYTLVDSEKNADNIVKAIKDGKYTLKTSPLSIPLFFKIAFFGSIAAFVKYRYCRTKQALSR